MDSGESERTVVEKICEIMGISVYFRIRRMSYWFPLGMIAFPIVFSVGNFGIGSNWFWAFRKDAGNLRRAR